MSIDLPASEEEKPGFRRGVCVKNDKLYAFSDVRVIVVRGWPEMSAWTRTYRNPNWSRLRPHIDFQEGIISAKRSRHQVKPGRYGRHAPESEDPFRTQPPEELAAIEMLNSIFGSDSDAISSPQTEKQITMNRRMEAIDREQQLVRRYFSDVPWGFRRAIAPFEGRHWHLLVMAARCAGSLDLITSNPALAYCLASCWAFGPYPSKYATRHMRRLIGATRRHICGALGFPETESSVSVLSKIPASACSVSWLLTVRDLLRDPDWRKPLLHLPSVDLPVLQFLCNRAVRRRTTTRLLHELSGSDAPALVSYAADVTRIEKRIGVSSEKRFNSIHQFQRYHETLLERVDQPTEADVRHYHFPQPPIPGNDNIVALETPDLLIEEARDQRNCATKYAGAIAQGGIYIYRVLQPERATLSIILNENGRWQVQQLLRARNKPASDTTHQTVAEWLLRMNQTLLQEQRKPIHTLNK
jgi:hypothetical protein